MVLRRGRGTKVNAYANGVHQDFGTNAEEFEANQVAYLGKEKGEAYREKFNNPQVTGHTNMVFWRTTNMEGPLHMKPLAVCDPTTVDRKDHIPVAIVGFSAAHDDMDTSQATIKYNPN
jgi:hypothetical protein